MCWSSFWNLEVTSKWTTGRILAKKNAKEILKGLLEEFPTEGKDFQMNSEKTPGVNPKIMPGIPSWFFSEKSLQILPGNPQKFLEYFYGSFPRSSRSFCRLLFSKFRYFFQESGNFQGFIGNSSSVFFLDFFVFWISRRSSWKIFRCNSKEISLKEFFGKKNPEGNLAGISGGIFTIF